MSGSRTARHALKRLLFWLVALPVALVAAAFAIANRGRVAVSLDPLPYAVDAPLYAVALAGFGAGLALGLAVTWPRLVRWRAAARGRARKIQALEDELARLNRERAERSQAGTAMVPAPGTTGGVTTTVAEIGGGPPGDVTAGGARNGGARP